MFEAVTSVMILVVTVYVALVMFVDTIGPTWLEYPAETDPFWELETMVGVDD